MRVPKEEWPHDWVAMRLGDLCEIQIGRTPRRSQPEYWGGPHTWVTIADMKDRVVVDAKKGITDKAIEDGQARLVKAGTLLMSFKLTIGKLAFAGRDLYTNEAIAALSMHDEFRDVVLEDFLYWALQAVPIAEEADLAVKGFTLNKGKIARIEIPVPWPDDLPRSLETQRRIVTRIEALFAEVGAARELHWKVVEDTGRLMDAVLAEVFDTKTADSWPNARRLEELVEISAPLVDPTLLQYRNLPHIHGGVIEEGTGRLLPYRTAAEDEMRSGKYLFKPGSVLYSKIRPYLRKATAVDFEGLCSADMYPLAIKANELAPVFLVWALMSPDFTDYANSLSSRARMPKLNRSQLLSYSLRYPDLPIQESIGYYLLAVREEIGEMRGIEDNDAALFDQAEQAILAQAFRGKL